jgi:hypothetical protein
MRKIIVLIALPILLCLSSLGEDGGVLNMASPKLKQFLANHSAASQTLVAAISESFSNRTVQLYYFYSNDEARPRALHYYPGDSAVGLAIRENQEPCDEYLCLIFEILNSQGEKRFKDLMEQAKAGTVSRKDFARGIMRQEFQAVQRVRGMLDGLKLSPEEKGASYYFKMFADCPDDFEKFLTYKPKGVTREPLKEYEQQYDSLRKKP